MEDEEVPLVDGVFEGALGALAPLGPKVSTLRPTVKIQFPDPLLKAASSFVSVLKEKKLSTSQVTRDGLNYRFVLGGISSYIKIKLVRLYSMELHFESQLAVGTWAFIGLGGFSMKLDVWRILIICKRAKISVGLSRAMKILSSFMVSSSLNVRIGIKGVYGGWWIGRWTTPCRVNKDSFATWNLMATLESPVSRDEVRNAVWGCGENKSPGPDGFSFEFFRKFWDTVVDFAKAYDSIRWDFLEDVLTAFGFGPKWCSWIRGCLHSGMASVLPQWGQFLVGVSWILSYAWFHVTSSHPFRYSTWLSIIREIHSLKDRGVDLVSHCRIHVGNGLRTNFWKEVWIGDNPLCVLFPRIFALETNKDSSVAVKLSSVTSSLRRPVRGGSESSQLSLLQEYIEGTILVLVARIGLEVEALVDAMEEFPKCVRAFWVRIAEARGPKQAKQVQVLSDNVTISIFTSFYCRRLSCNAFVRNDLNPPINFFYGFLTFGFGAIQVVGDVVTSTEHISSSSFLLARWKNTTNDIFVFDGAVRVNTLKLMNFFRSRKVGMIWSFGFLRVCKRTKIPFVYEYDLAIEWNYEDLTKLLEGESDEFVLNYEGDKNDAGVISLKSDLTIKVQNKMRDNSH
ncbi:hypothetical protein Tco_1255498 [Tanacetum coccineum]